MILDFVTPKSCTEQIIEKVCQKFDEQFFVDEERSSALHPKNDAFKNQQISLSKKNTEVEEKIDGIALLDSKYNADKLSLHETNTIMSRENINEKNGGNYKAILRSLKRFFIADYNKYTKSLSPNNRTKDF